MRPPSDVRRVRLVMKDPISFSIGLYNTQFGCFADIPHNVTGILTHSMGRV